jgi:carbohydrate-binding DOMON domain-containing protein
MAFDNDDVEPDVEEEEAGPPPEESSNRPFIIVAAILGGITLLSLLCVLAYALIWLPRSRQAQEANATAAAQTMVALSVQQTQAAEPIPPTWTRVPPTATTRATATRTPVLAPGGATSTSTLTAEEHQATIAAMLTEAAVTAGAVSPTPTALPQGGIFDEWNPALIIGLALVLVAVIVIARRLRTV